MSNQTPHPPDLAEPWVELIRRKVEAIRFGSVEILIHEGRVTQLEVREKTRVLPLDSAAKTLRPPL